FGIATSKEESGEAAMHLWRLTNRGWFVLLLAGLVSWTALGSGAVWAQNAKPAETAAAEEETAEVVPTGEVESEIASHSVFTRALKGGWIVFSCLLILVFLSIMSWAVVVAKWIYLQRMNKTNDAFIKSFWDSRSLNDLNSRLGEYPYSPAREVFRSGYAELVRGSQLRDQASSSELAVSAAMDNLHRALHKSKSFEKRRMEKFI